MTIPHVSVIIPYFNAQRWIGDTVRSVLAQEGLTREIILIDDGSSDNGAKEVARVYPELRLVRTENQGPSRARNLGTTLARGRYLQYLDADDLLAPGKLGTQLAALENTGADVA